MIRILSDMRVKYTLSIYYSIQVRSMKLELILLGKLYIKDDPTIQQRVKYLQIRMNTLIEKAFHCNKKKKEYESQVFGPNQHEMNLQKEREEELRKTISRNPIRKNQLMADYHSKFKTRVSIKEYIDIEKPYIDAMNERRVVEDECCSSSNSFELQSSFMSTRRNESQEMSKMSKYKSKSPRKSKNPKKNNPTLVVNQKQGRVRNTTSRGRFATTMELEKSVNEAINSFGRSDSIARNESSSVDDSDSMDEEPEEESFGNELVENNNKLEVEIAISEVSDSQKWNPQTLVLPSESSPLESTRGFNEPMYFGTSHNNNLHLGFQITEPMNQSSLACKDPRMMKLTQRQTTIDAPKLSKIKLNINNDYTNRVDIRMIKCKVSTKTIGKWILQERLQVPQHVYNYIFNEFQNDINQMTLEDIHNCINTVYTQPELRHHRMWMNKQLSIYDKQQFILNLVLNTKDYQLPQNIK